jgi:hypothetical protein
MTPEVHLRDHRKLIYQKNTVNHVEWTILAALMSINAKRQKAKGKNTISGETIFLAILEVDLRDHFS